MNWFRIYHEARNDAKLRTLSDSQFRIWFNLLCLSSEQPERGTIEEYDFDLLSIEVAGGDDDLLRSAIKQLQRLRILSDDGSTICFLHFLDRQYDKPSDKPAAVKERVTRHRETSNKEGVTPSNAVKREETHREDKIREEENREEDSREDVCGADAPLAQFEAQFWQAFPERNGKKLFKAKAMQGLRRIKPVDWPSVLVAVGNYAESGQGPMDAFRFLQADYWRDWIEPAARKFGQSRQRSKAAESAAFLTEVINATSKGNTNGQRSGRAHEDGGPLLEYFNPGKRSSG